MTTTKSPPGSSILPLMRGSTWHRPYMTYSLPPIMDSPEVWRIFLVRHLSLPILSALPWECIGFQRVLHRVSCIFSASTACDSSPL